LCLLEVLLEVLDGPAQIFDFLALLSDLLALVDIQSGERAEFGEQ
jgi:hypothetical protein